MIATDWVTNGWLKCCLMYSRNFWLNKLSRRSECILPDRKTAASFDLAAVAVVVCGSHTAPQRTNQIAGGAATSAKPYAAATLGLGPGTGYLIRGPASRGTAELNSGPPQFNLQPSGRQKLN